MWNLVSIDHPDVHHALVCGREYSLGRKDADIILEGDMSISRKHAVIQATHSIADVSNPLRLPQLSIEDLSKIGSSVGDQRHIKGTGEIHNHDIVWFGNLQSNTSKYRAEYQPYIATTSCLDPASKKSCRQLVCELGGHIAGDWRNDCDVLIMNSLSITIKAICALIAQKPIITPKYLDDWIKALKNGTKPPNSDDYLPPLAESQLDPREVSFKINPKRQEIFQGLIFIFLTSKQFKKLSVAVESGGGTPMLLESPDIDGDDILIAPGSCVMSCDLNDQSQQLTKKAHDWIEHVLKILQKKKKRVIQECEIGYAVLYCSVDTHCNPSGDPSNPGPPAVPIVPQTLSQTAGISQLQATQTQHRDDAPSQQPEITNLKVKGEMISQKTPEDTVSYSVTNSKKRGRESEDSGVTPAKRSNIQRGLSLKHEIITPQKSPDEIPEDNNVIPAKTKTYLLESVPGRRSTRKSPSPSPTSPKQPRRSTRNSPSPGPPSPKQRRRNTRNSPSPGPPSPKQRRRNTRNSPSPTPPSPKPPSRNTRKHSPELYDPDTMTTSGKTEAKMRDTDDDYTSRKAPGKQSKITFSSDDNASSGEEGDIFASVPRRKGRGKIDVKPDQNVAKSNSPSPDRNVQRKATYIKSEPDISIDIAGSESEEIHVRGNRDAPRNQREEPSTRHRVKQERQVIEEDTGLSLTKNVDRFPDPDGFISKNDTGARPVDSEFIDRDVVAADNITEVRSLIVRKPGQGQRPKVNDIGEDRTRWQGVVVKNFKNFRKTGHAGLNSLPHIIGGTDLIAHENSLSQKHDSWYKEYVESESPSHRSQTEANDGFDFEAPRVSSSSRKGRR